MAKATKKQVQGRGLTSILKESNDGFVSESGEVERWVGKINKDKVNEATQEVIDYLEKLKT